MLLCNNTSTKNIHTKMTTYNLLVKCSSTDRYDTVVELTVNYRPQCPYIVSVSGIGTSSNICNDTTHDTVVIKIVTQPGPRKLQEVH